MSSSEILKRWHFSIIHEEMIGGKRENINLAIFCQTKQKIRNSLMMNILDDILPLKSLTVFLHWQNYLAFKFGIFF